MSNLSNTVDLGICPSCGQGHILKTSTDYVCTNRLFPSNGVKTCRLSIPLHLHGVSITDSIIKQLIESRKTDEMELKDCKGNLFPGRFIIIPGRGLEVEYHKDYVFATCPDCGGKLVKTKSRYACENSLSKHPTCHFFIPNFICQRKITESEVEDFCNGNADILDDFIDRRSGRHFSAFLDKQPNGSVCLNSEVGRCPVCGGSVLVGDKAFNCSNYKQGCKFHIWRNYEYHRISLAEARDLLRNGRLSTPFSAYDEKGLKTQYSLVISPSGDVQMIPYVKRQRL